MRNSGNYDYDYAHSFFGKDLENPRHYTGADQTSSRRVDQTSSV